MKQLFDGTHDSRVPSNNKLFDRRVPSRKQLFDGTVPSNSFSLLLAFKYNLPAQIWDSKYLSYSTINLCKFWWIAIDQYFYVTLLCSVDWCKVEATDESVEGLAEGWLSKGWIFMSILSLRLDLIVSESFARCIDESLSSNSKVSRAWIIILVFFLNMFLTRS